MSESEEPQENNSTLKRNIILGIIALVIIFFVGRCAIESIQKDTVGSEQELMDIDIQPTNQVSGQQTPTKSSSTIVFVDGSLWEVLELENEVILDPNGRLYDRGKFKNIETGETIFGKCQAPGWNDPYIGMVYQIHVFTNETYGVLNYVLLVPVDEDPNDPYQRFMVIEE